MKPQHILCPIVALLDRSSSNENEKAASTYGAVNPVTMTLDLPNPVTVWIMAVMWIIFLMFALVGMSKAFSCGSAMTNFGLTGTGWGVIILVLGLVMTPVGGLFGIAFALGGGCMPGLLGRM